jgi:parallel beta-helix repeat protein
MPYRCTCAAIRTEPCLQAGTKEGRRLPLRRVAGLPNWVVRAPVEHASPDNDLIGNSVSGIGVEDSPGTKNLSNDVSRSGIVGTFMAGPKQANAKVVGNNISGGPFGIYVADTKRGSIAGNTVRNTCAGMFFEADGVKDPVSGFEVKGNTVKNNTRSCRASKFDRDFSGIGIALLGASGMEVTGNHLSDNVPSGPTPVSGGVVVATDPFFGGTAKPTNNSVTGNHFGRNKPDIF